MKKTILSVMPVLLYFGLYFSFQTEIHHSILPALTRSPILQNMLILGGLGLTIYLWHKWVFPENK